MPSKYQRRLFSHLAHEDYTARPIAELALDLRVEDPEDFRRAVSELQSCGHLKIDPTGRVSLTTLADLAIAGGDPAGDRGQLREAETQRVARLDRGVAPRSSVCVVCEELTSQRIPP